MHPDAVTAFAAIDTGDGPPADIALRAHVRGGYDGTPPAPATA